MEETKRVEKEMMKLNDEEKTIREALTELEKKKRVNVEDDKNREAAIAVQEGQAVAVATAPQGRRLPSMPSILKNKKPKEGKLRENTSISIDECREILKNEPITIDDLEKLNTPEDVAKQMINYQRCIENPGIEPTLRDVWQQNKKDLSHREVKLIQQGRKHKI